MKTTDRKYRQADNGIQWYVEQYLMDRVTQKHRYFIEKVFYSEGQCMAYIGDR